LIYQRRWTAAADGTPIARVTGNVASKALFQTDVSLDDTTSARGHAFALILDGEGTSPIVTARPFRLSAIQEPWLSVSGPSSLVFPAADGRTIGLGTHGPNGVQSIYRIDLVPTGEPTWLLEFDAANAGDIVRTYGLGRLFESFRITAKRSIGATSGPDTVRPLARLFVVAQ
jgi:hypothetical protein